MTAKDQLKIIKAGFTIIRKDEVNMRIKFKQQLQTEWAYMDDRFTSKAAMELRVKEILKLSTIVED